MDLEDILYSCCQSIGVGEVLTAIAKVVDRIGVERNGDDKLYGASCDLFDVRNRVTQDRWVYNRMSGWQVREPESA